MISRVDEYLHAVPVSGSVPEQIGPFTLFRSTTVWPYYARPVPGSGATIEPADIDLLRSQCEELDIPLSFEWVVETCPSLGPAAAAAGLKVVEHPLLVLGRDEFRPATSDARCEILPPEDDVLRQARAVASLAFGDPGTAIGDAGPADRDAKQRYRTTFSRRSSTESARASPSPRPRSPRAAWSPAANTSRSAPPPRSSASAPSPRCGAAASPPPSPASWPSTPSPTASTSSFYQRRARPSPPFTNASASIASPPPAPQSDPDRGGWLGVGGDRAVPLDG